MEPSIVTYTESAWQQEIRQAFRDTRALSDFLQAPVPELKDYPLFVPKALAHRIKQAGPGSALWQQFVPSTAELLDQAQGLADPIGDQVHEQHGQLVHRYQNRVLFMPVTQCPVNCRYCFRKNELFEPRLELFRPSMDDTLSYLHAHPEIEEIIFSGGDPLMLSDRKLAFYLEQFAQIPHIRHIRFHTRTPVILPQRIDASFIATLLEAKKYFAHILVAIHVNHSEEIDASVAQALKQLAQAPGIELLSQTVLLKGVNDELESLVALLNQLSDLGVRPYYLHHPDKVLGGMNFYLSLEQGRRLYQGLRDRLPGWMLPHYVVDIPGGEGKSLAHNPEAYSFSGSLLNRKGDIVFYDKSKVDRPNRYD